MNIGRERLKPISTLVVEFGGDVVHPVGTITLPVTIGTAPQQITSLTDSLVVDRPSVYNIILDHPSLNAARAITSTYHLKMKFPTPHETGMIKENQATARNCYMMTLQSKTKARETLIVKDLEVRGEYLQISKLDDNPTRIPINELSKLLNGFADVFAWLADDIPGIDPAIMEHRLQVDPNHKPVKQKKRSFALERVKVIDEEVTKLVWAKFVRRSTIWSG
ncbi:uncharacterized protein LOC131148360 [Malania oleifera]|uniref:uncharacterized protein LOC131148360 n=1 Tax=Malania oleifera TaxID=397392 RepID=UPI0025ADC8BA|nr:uncharacterized protein LOC131148360 [Malania oleifera]